MRKLVSRFRSFSLRRQFPACAHLVELYAHGKQVPISSEPGSSPVDVRIYLTDARRAMRDFGWKPERDVKSIVEEIAEWVRAHEDELRPIIA